jgi:hypothetical protein
VEVENAHSGTCENSGAAFLDPAPAGILAPDGITSGSVYRQPIAEVEVKLIDSSGQEWAAKSGPDGVAVFHPPKPGPFLATASHDEYVPVRYDAYYPFEGAQLVRTGTQDEPPRCALQLKPRSSIAGVVTDSERKPVSGAAVTALWRTFQAGDATFMFAAEAKSDDAGSFLLPRLLPGVYILRADPPPGQPASGPAFRTTYFSLAPDATSAAQIRLPAGSSMGGLRLVLETAPKATLTLRVTSTTRNLVDDEVTVMRGINDFSRLLYGPGCCSRQRLVNGDLIIKEAPAGTYTFQVTAKIDGQEQEGSVTLTLGDRPAHADVTLAPLQDLRARVIRRRERESAPRDRPVTALLLPVGIGLPLVSGVVDANDTVTFERVKAGTYRWAVGGLNPSQYAELWVNGQPAAGNFIAIPSGPIALEFRIIEGAATLQVDAEDADSCIGTSLVVLPENAAQTAFSERAERFGCTFKASGLRPGEYSIALVRNMEEGQASQVSFRSKLSGLVRISLEPGEREQIKARIQDVPPDY